MQLSRLLPDTRKSYVNKKVEVKHVLFTGEAVLTSFHNNTHAVIQFAEPMKQQSALRQRGELRTLTIDIKYLHI